MRLKKFTLISLLLTVLVSVSLGQADIHDELDPHYLDSDGDVAEASAARSRMGSFSGRSLSGGNKTEQKALKSPAQISSVGEFREQSLDNEIAKIDSEIGFGDPRLFPVRSAEASDSEEEEGKNGEDETPDTSPDTLPDDVKPAVEEYLKENDRKRSNLLDQPSAEFFQDIGLTGFGPNEDGEREPPIALFTIANTNISTSFANLPYREKYQWQDRNAPCHTFELKVPDELAEKSMITLCIFRPNLEFVDETKLFISNTETIETQPDQNVMGHVVNSPGSYVVGRIVDKNFFGQVTIPDKDALYVVEDISMLDRLMRNNQKTLRNMLMVMHAQDKKQNKKMVYNAVVTKGSSLTNFMMYTGSVNNKNTFLMFSTSHNSYIAAGEPTMHVDEHGQVKLQTGSNKIYVVNDGSIKIKIPDKLYTFRPNGRTIVKEKGMERRTLQEHEGSVAITAYTSSSTYDCVLPTPAFEAKRKGGYLCTVCLAMDESFRDHYLSKVVPKNDSDLFQNYLGTRIIDRVSWIFRSMDLNGDNKPDNIGLDFENPPLNWTYPDVGEEDVSEQDIELLFQSLETYHFADCCLGIGFTMKNFPMDLLGTRTQAKSSPSGVCAGRTGRIPNNLIIMSANNKAGNYKRVREDQLIYATANQIASAFGARSDENGNDVCDQFQDDHGVTRHYLMWGNVMRNTTLIEQSLSTCSKTDVMKTLSTCISSCFDIDRHPFCGNGIVEEGEECDCGSERSCLQQTCCYSRTGKHPCRKTGVGCTSGAFSFFVGAFPNVALFSSLLLSFGRHLLVN